jgi:DNA-binding NarL/FixJ family response regulator
LEKRKKEGSMNFEELQQPAGVAGQTERPAGTLPLRTLGSPRLHSLSVEHAAIALKLSQKEEHLVMLLGEGLDDRRVAQRMAIEVQTMRSRLKHLKTKLRMSRLSLAILGYQLAGQCDEQDAA